MAIVTASSIVKGKPSASFPAPPPMSNPANPHKSIVSLAPDPRLRCALLHARLACPSSAPSSITSCATVAWIASAAVTSVSFITLLMFDSMLQMMLLLALRLLMGEAR
jgi:hypothetical protein